MAWWSPLISCLKKPCPLSAELRRRRALPAGEAEQRAEAGAPSACLGGSPNVSASISSYQEAPAAASPAASSQVQPALPRSPANPAQVQHPNVADSQIRNPSATTSHCSKSTKPLPQLAPPPELPSGRVLSPQVYVSSPAGNVAAEAARTSAPAVEAAASDVADAPHPYYRCHHQQQQQQLQQPSIPLRSSYQGTHRTLQAVWSEVAPFAFSMPPQGMVDAAALAVATVARLGPMPSRSVSRSRSVSSQQVSALGLGTGSLPHALPILTPALAAAVSAAPAVLQHAPWAAPAPLPADLPAQTRLSESSTVSISSSDENDDDDDQLSPSGSVHYQVIAGSSGGDAGALTAPAAVNSPFRPLGAGQGGGGGGDRGVRLSPRSLQRQNAAEAAFIRGTLAALKQATLASFEGRLETEVLPGLPRVRQTHEQSSTNQHGSGSAAASVVAVRASGSGTSEQRGPDSTTNTAGIMEGTGQHTQPSLHAAVHKANLATIFGGGGSTAAVAAADASTASRQLPLRTLALVFNEGAARQVPGQSEGVALSYGAPAAAAAAPVGPPRTYPPTSGDWGQAAFSGSGKFTGFHSPLDSPAWMPMLPPQPPLPSQGAGLAPAPGPPPASTHFAEVLQQIFARATAAQQQLRQQLQKEHLEQQQRRSLVVQENNGVAAAAGLAGAVPPPPRASSSSSSVPQPAVHESGSPRASQLPPPPSQRQRSGAEAQFPRPAPSQSHPPSAQQEPGPQVQQPDGQARQQHPDQELRLPQGVEEHHAACADDASVRPRQPPPPLGIAVEPSRAPNSGGFAEISVGLERQHFMEEVKEAQLTGPPIGASFDLGCSTMHSRAYTDRMPSVGVCSSSAAAYDSSVQAASPTVAGRRTNRNYAGAGDGGSRDSDHGGSSCGGSKPSNSKGTLTAGNGGSDSAGSDGGLRAVDTTAAAPAPAMAASFAAAAAPMAAAAPEAEVAAFASQLHFEQPEALTQLVREKRSPFSFPLLPAAVPLSSAAAAAVLSPEPAALMMPPWPLPSQPAEMGPERPLAALGNPSTATSGYLAVLAAAAAVDATASGVTSISAGVEAQLLPRTLAHAPSCSVAVTASSYDWLYSSGVSTSRTPSSLAATAAAMAGSTSQRAVGGSDSAGGIVGGSGGGSIVRLSKSSYVGARNLAGIMLPPPTALRSPVRATSNTSQGLVATAALTAPYDSSAFRRAVSRDTMRPLPGGGDSTRCLVRHAPTQGHDGMAAVAASGEDFFSALSPKQHHCQHYQQLLQLQQQQQQQQRRDATSPYAVPPLRDGASPRVLTLGPPELAAAPLLPPAMAVAAPPAVAVPSGADLQYVKSLVNRKWSPFFELEASLSNGPWAPTLVPGAQPVELPPTAAPGTLIGAVQQLGPQAGFETQPQAPPLLPQQERVIAQREALRARLPLAGEAAARALLEPFAVGTLAADPPLPTAAAAAPAVAMPIPDQPPAQQQHALPAPVAAAAAPPALVLSGADLQYVRSLIDRRWSPFFELEASLRLQPLVGVAPPSGELTMTHGSHPQISSGCSAADTAPVAPG